MSLLSGMKRLARSLGLGKKRKKTDHGKNNLAPVDIAKLPEKGRELDPAVADVYFTDLEQPGPWLKLDQKGLSGWQIREGKNTRSIDGPLRIWVKSVVMKSIQFGRITDYGHGPVHDQIKKLAEEDFTKAAWGPEYELELVDLDNMVVRYFVCSPSAKAVLSGALWVGRETNLGHKVDKFHSNGRTEQYLVPVAWEPQ